MSEAEEPVDTAPEAPNDDAAHILVVDDDNRIRDLLSRYLATRGYRVTTACDASTARARLQSMFFDLIVLDAMMPGENGFDFAHSLRSESDVPILMLTARVETDDRVRGLEAGADDYVTKPFDPKELALRIASILRRAARRAAAPEGSTAVRFGDFLFRVERAELFLRGALVRLTDRERGMMSLLAQTPGEVVPREALAGPAPSGNERTIDVQVNRLRRKIEADPAAPLYLQTVRGIGYRLAVDR